MTTDLWHTNERGNRAASDGRHRPSARSRYTEYVTGLVRAGGPPDSCRHTPPHDSVIPVTAALDLIRRVLRGDDPPEVLTSLGVRIERSERGSITVTPPNDLTLPPCPLSDLARGLLTHWALGNGLQEWATAVLMIDAIQFDEADTPQEGRLLDAVWAAMTRQPISDDALELARQLAR